MTAIDSEIPAGTRLRAMLQLAMPMIHSERLPSFWETPRVRTFYPRYLAVIYPAIKFAVPLIKSARDICVQRSGEAEFYGKLATFYEHKVTEELDHDLWLLDDLARMGYSSDEIKRRTPLPSVAALTGAQHFYLAYGNPAALLGYMSALEGFPPTDPMLDAAVKATGYPESCFRTLRKHAHLDLFHRDELEAVVSEVGLSEGDLAIVTSNALTTIQRVGLVMDDIASEHPLTILDHEN